MIMCFDAKPLLSSLNYLHVYAIMKCSYIACFYLFHIELPYFHNLALSLFTVSLLHGIVGIMRQEHDL